MMNDPHRNKMPSCGNGSHVVVHRCHKCGWPFPNPHPSAKHRRAHKKACGTIEGYKLLHPSAASEDIEDYLSDEDQKANDVAESKSNPKSIRFSGTGSILNRSTDEVFSDAVPEFHDSACSSENEDRVENDSREIASVDSLGRVMSGAFSFKDCTDADILESPRYSSDGSQVQYPDVQHSISNLPGTAPDYQNRVLNSSRESLHVLVDDRNGSMEALFLSKLEQHIDVLEEHKRLHAVETAEQSSPRYSSDGSQVQYPDAQHSTPNLPGTAPDYQNRVLNSSRESLHVLVDDRNGSMEALSLSKLEQHIDVLEEHKRLHAVETAEQSSPVCRQGTKAKTNNKRKLVDESTCWEHADQVSEAESNANKREEITSAALMTGGLPASITMPVGKTVWQEDHQSGDHETFSERNLANMTVLDDGFGVFTSETAFKPEQRENSLGTENGVQLEEAGNHSLAPGHHTGGLPSESVSSKKNYNAAITSHVENDFAPEVGKVTLLNGEQAERTSEVQREIAVTDGRTSQSKEEGNNILAPNIDAGYPLSKSQLLEQKDATVIDQEKDAAANSIQVKKDVPPEADSTSSAKSNACLGNEDEGRESVHVLSMPDNIPVVMLGDFKDNKKVKLQPPVTLSSGELPNSKANDIGELFPEESTCIIHLHGLENDLGLENTASRIKTKGALVEEEVAIKTGISDSSEVERGCEVCSREEQELQDISGDLHQIDFSESGLKVSSDANSMHPVDFEANQPGNVVGIDDVGNIEKDGNIVHYLSGNASNIGVLRKAHKEMNVASPESSRIHAETEAGDLANGLNGKHDKDVMGTSGGQLQNHMSNKTGSLSESCSIPQVIVEDVVGNLDSQGDSKGEDRVVDTNGPETSFSTESGHGLESDTEKSMKGNLKKRSCQSSLGAELPFRSFAAVEEGHSEKFLGVASESSAASLQGDLDNSFTKNQIHTSAADLSVESGSQEDSLECNWGSVSENAAAMETEASPSPDPQTTVAEKAHSVRGRNASAGHHSDEPDTFEAPSFMTWVDPGYRNQKAANSETLMALSPQVLKATPEQAGWFPKLANVTNKSPGRKKNEEWIAKITNWSMRQQAPVKNISGEAGIEAKLRSPLKPNENPAFMLTKHAEEANGHEHQTTTVGAILSSEALVNESKKTAAAQEWNSPARYPVAIKTEGKRVKSRPYWAQFVCCLASSVNY